MAEIELNGPLLCIDTSIPVGSVAVVDPGDDIPARTRTGPNYRAEKLFVVIQDLLADCGLTPSQLGGVAVASGPGSFTGLRIAASTAKTLAWTLDKPLFAAGSLLCQASHAADTGVPVCAAFDAGRSEFYAACYRWPANAACEELLAPGAFDMESLCHLLLALAGGQGLVMLGQGYLKYRDELDKHLGDVLKPVDDSLHEPDAAALGSLVLSELERYLVEKVGTFEPDYIRFGQAGLRLGQ